MLNCCQVSRPNSYRVTLSIEKRIFDFNLKRKIDVYVLERRF